MAADKPFTAPKSVLVTQPLDERVREHQTSLIAARDQLRLQLNGVENQLYLIDQLLNPKPVPEEAPPPPDTPPDTPPGTI